MEQTMTERLYYADPYQKEFTAKVTGCTSCKQGYAVTLDRTAFYPEGGGQPADTGFLGSVKVLDVQDKNGEILHTTNGPLEIGVEVQGEIDWARRFLLMQQHTGEHILSGITNWLYQLDNVGFHMGAKAVTVDFNGELSTEQLQNIEKLANEAVYADLPVLAVCPTREELKDIPYRSKKELDGEVRIVTVPGYDSCACCGLHTARTGEVGIIKVVGSQRYKGGMRITLQLGSRALEDYDEKTSHVAAISNLLSAKPEEVVSAVERLLADRDALKQQVAQMRAQIFAQKAASLPGGQERACVFEEGLSPADLRTFCLMLCERVLLAAVFSGDEQQGWKYAIAGKEDVRPIGKALNQAFSGRGGGTPELVQGSLQGSREALEQWMQSYRK